MAGRTIVFDPSTTDSEPDNHPILSPIKQKIRRVTEIIPVTEGSTTESDSDYESQNLAKKTNRKTVRGCNRGLPRQPLDDVSNDNAPLINIYTKPLSISGGGLYGRISLAKSLDSDDVEEDELVIRVSKNTRTSRKQKLGLRPKKMVTSVVEDNDSVEEVIAIEESPSRNRSPTPPPSQPARPAVRKRKTKAARETARAMGNLESLRGRLKEKKHDKFNDSVDDVFIIEDPIEAFYEKTLTIKIRTVSGIHRIPMKQKESFERVMKEMAKKASVPLENIVLYLGDHNIQVYETPQLLKLTIVDILDCHTVLCAPDTSSDEDDDLDDPTMIRLRIRGTDKRTPSKTIKLLRTDPLERLMRIYAKRCGHTFEKLKFTFDGDTVKRTDTVDLLDMENDDCIDVIAL